MSSVPIAISPVRPAKIVVGVSELAVSREIDQTLTTYALGSCIGVAAYDATLNVAGLLHFQLPESSLDAQRAAQRPAMFADTGVAALLDQMQTLGALPRRLSIRLAGGAQMLNDNGLFDIGRRNHAAIRKVLWKHGLFIEREMIGGREPMTMILEVGTGILHVKCNGRTTSL